MNASVYSSWISEVLAATYCDTIYIPYSSSWQCSLYTSARL